MRLGGNLEISSPEHQSNIALLKYYLPSKILQKRAKKKTNKKTKNKKQKKKKTQVKHYTSIQVNTFDKPLFINNYSKFKTYKCKCLCLRASPQFCYFSIWDYSVHSFLWKCNSVQIDAWAVRGVSLLCTPHEQT